MPDRTSRKNDDVLGGAADVLEQMSAEHNRHARPELSEQLPKLNPLLGVKPDRGFVQQQNARIIDNSLSDPHSS